MFALGQLPGQIEDGAATTFATVNGSAAGDAHHEHRAKKLDIKGDVNHSLFGPKSFKDCRKMGNDVIFEFVLNHTSRMAPSGAVLEAYMTLTTSHLAIYFLRVCHPPFGCKSRFTGLAVADLVSRSTH